MFAQIFMREDTFQKITELFNFGIFAAVWAFCGWPQPTRVDGGTAVIFSVKCFQSSKTVFSLTTCLMKVICLILHTHSWALNGTYIFNSTFYWC